MDDEETETANEAWRRYNAEKSTGEERTEHYPAGDEEEGATLALRLQHEGLIGAINRDVLHPLGLALGVTARSAAIDLEAMRAGEATGLTVHATSDPEGYCFPPEAHERINAKLRAAGHEGLIR